jgi:hypothetical protein
MLVTCIGARGEGAPRIACDEPTWDFGTVGDVPFVDHTFVLRNDGDADLTITRVRPSCGCTTTGLSTETIHPGETAELATRFGLKGRRGAQHKSIAIESNDPVSPNFRLELKATIERVVDFRPERIFLQVSDATPAATGSVRVTFSTPEPHAISEVSVTPADILAVESTDVQPGQMFDIAVRTIADIDLSQPHRTGQVTMATDHPDFPTLTIPVVLQVVRDFVLAPDKLVVDTNVTGRMMQQILVRNRRPEAIELLSVTPSGEGVTVTPRKVNDTIYRLEVVFDDPTSVRDGDRIAISVRHGEGKPDEYSVPIVLRNM